MSEIIQQSLIIKRFSELNREEVQSLYDFAKSFQPSGFYDKVEQMKDYYGGSLLGFGRQHLSCWVEGRPVASAGWIDKEIHTNRRLFFTHGFVGEQGQSCWEVLFKEILLRAGQDQEQNHDQGVEQLKSEDLELRLGVRGQGNQLENWVQLQGWEPLFNMLAMSIRLTSAPEGELRIEELRGGYLDGFFKNPQWWVRTGTQWWTAGRL